jgi:4-amino-4-deoxy-L-arabinose transferase-like glycosyltransferase
LFRPGHPPTLPAVGALLVILVLALGLRVVAWHRATMMFNDGPNFLWQAERLADGQWMEALAHPYHPMYAALTALVRPLTGDVETAAVVVSMAAGLALCVIAYGMVRLLMPDVRGAAVAAALVAAVLTRSLDVTADIQADGIFAAFALGSVWATLAAAQAGGCKRRLALAGVLAGLAYLTRAEGLFVGLAPGLWLLFGGPRPALAGRGIGMGAWLVALALTVAPYGWALHGVTGEWCLSLKPSMANLGLGPSGEMWQAPADSPMGWPLVPSEHQSLVRPDDQPSAGAPKEGGFTPTWFPPLALVAQDAPAPPARPGLGSALNRAALQFVTASRLETLLLALPGLLLLLRERRKATLGGLIMVVGWIAVCTVQVHRSHFLVNRHMILAIVLLLPAAGVGLWRLSQNGRPWRVLGVLAIAVAAGAGTRAQRTHHAPRLEALTWVREHTTPDQYVVSHRQRDGWYAQRAAVTAQLPVYDQILRSRLAEFDVPYLVFRTARVESLEPHWLADGLVREVARFGEGEDTVAVYEPHFGDG